MARQKRADGKFKPPLPARSAAAVKKYVQKTLREELREAVEEVLDGVEYRVADAMEKECEAYAKDIVEKIEIGLWGTYTEHVDGELVYDGVELSLTTDNYDVVKNFKLSDLCEFDGSPDGECAEEWEMMAAAFEDCGRRARKMVGAIRENEERLAKLRRKK